MNPKELVNDGLWAMVGFLLTLESPKPKGGRPSLPVRAALEGIVYVLGAVSCGECFRKRWGAEPASPAIAAR